MRLLYTFSIQSYSFIIHLASLFNKKAKLWVEGRKNIFAELKSKVKDESVLWFHCASLGEFEQGRPLIEKLKTQYPKQKILLTFFSPSGYEIRKNYTEADDIFYLPIDTQKNAKKFIEIVKPKAAFFIKYEFWFNYLNILKERGIPVFLVSGIFRENHHFFKWHGKWFRKHLNNFSHIFLQNESSKLLLDAINIKNASISGDTRFDRVCTIAAQAKKIPVIDFFKQTHKLLIAGSTWHSDEELLIKFINEQSIGNFKFIIAPHEIREENIERIKNSIKSEVVMFSQADNENIVHAKVLIIDNIGMLSSLYQYADIAYIGGGFGKGIHNVLEAAVFGMPIIIGPNYKKFKEAEDLVHLGGTFSIDSYDEFLKKIKFLLSDPLLIPIASMITKGYVNKNKGATEIILKEIKAVISL